MSGQLLSLGLLLVVTATAPTFNFVLPIRPTWLLFLLPAQINWLIVALVGVVGSTIGVLPLFWAMKKVKDAATVQKWLRYRWLQRFLQRFKHRPFLLIIALTLTPIPDQLIGILGALENYPLKKYVLANAIGRLFFYIPIALAGQFFRGDINRLEEGIIRWLGL